MAAKLVSSRKFSLQKGGLIPLFPFATLGAVYLLHKVITLEGNEAFVLRMVWIAGKLWSVGENPYASNFIAEYRNSGAGPVGVWNYPPYWYPIAIAISRLSLPAAAALWKATDIALLVAATHLVARALADVAHRNYASIFAVGFGFVCFMQATAVRSSMVRRPSSYILVSLQLLSGCSSGTAHGLQ